MIHRQIIRYAVIGLLLNALLYVVYLLLTRTLLASRTAMTITYCAGVLTGFVLNRRITFAHQGEHVGALVRYCTAYLIGYAINYAALWLLVDHAGMAHEIVQAGVMVTLPILLFMLQRYWVFPGPSQSGPGIAARPPP